MHIEAIRDAYQLLSRRDPMRLKPTVRLVSGIPSLYRLHRDCIYNNVISDEVTIEGAEEGREIDGSPLC